MFVVCMVRGYWGLAHLEHLDGGGGAKESSWRVSGSARGTLNTTG